VDSFHRLSSHLISLDLLVITQTYGSIRTQPAQVYRPRATVSAASEYAIHRIDLREIWCPQVAILVLPPLSSVTGYGNPRHTVFHDDRIRFP